MSTTMKPAGTPDCLAITASNLAIAFIILFVAVSLLNNVTEPAKPPHQA